MILVYILIIAAVWVAAGFASAWIGARVVDKKVYTRGDVLLMSAEGFIAVWLLCRWLVKSVDWKTPVQAFLNRPFFGK